MSPVNPDSLESLPPASTSLSKRIGGWGSPFECLRLALFFCGLFVLAKRKMAWGSLFDEQVRIRICCGTCGISLRYRQQERSSPTLVRASDLRKHGRGDRI